MGVNYVNARHKQRIASAADWNIANSVLLSGELAIESDTRKLKAGDGHTAYNALPFLNSFIVKQISLLADGWKNKQYIIDDSDIKRGSIILFDAPVGVSESDYKALQAAVIVASTQNDGQLTLEALGTVPKVDLTADIAII